MPRRVIIKGSPSSGWYAPPKGTHSGDKHRSVGSGKAVASGKKPVKSKKSYTNLSVDSMTSEQKKLIVSAVHDVGQDLFGHVPSGFIWEGNPTMADYGPKEAIAGFNEMGVWEDQVLNARNAGIDVFDGTELGSPNGYLVSIDMAGGKSLSPGESMSWREVNAFYDANPGKLLVNLDSPSNVIHIIRRVPLSQSVVDNALKNTDAIMDIYYTQTGL